MKFKDSNTFSGISAAALGVGVAISMLVMALWDTLRFSRIELSPENTFPLKIVLVALASGFAVRLFRNRMPKQKQQPGSLLRQGGRFILLTSVGVFAAHIFEVSFTEFSAPANFRSLFSAYLFGGVGLIVCLRQLMWLDEFIRIRRTKYTNRYRMLMFGGISLGFILQYADALHGSQNPDSGYFSFFLVGGLFTLASQNMPWVSSLSKDEKWRLLALSLGILALDALFLSMFWGNNYYDRMFRIFVPGLEIIVGMAFLLSALFFSHITFLLLLALPTASVVDRKTSEVRSLSYLSRIMTQVYDIEHLLKMVTTMTSEVCKATGAWVELADENGETTVAAQHGIPNTHVELLYKDGVMRSLVRNQAEISTLHIEDLSEWKEFAPVYKLTSKFARSLIAVPLIIESKRIGTLFAIHSEEFAFEMEDMSLLLAFADNISIAIENARLFESSLEKERYKRELTLARQIQQKLLPNTVPSVRGFDLAAYTSPALEVGGDYYDFVTLQNGEMCIIIGDVSGKGISAAFYVAELKGIVLALARESSSPADLLKRINRALWGAIDKQSYITITALSIHETTRLITVARAGHTPLLIRRKGAVEQLTPKGLGVGLAKPAFFDSVLEEITLDLEGSDALLLHTDGVNESLNADNEEFGYDALNSILIHNSSGRSDFLVGEVIRRVAEHSGGTAQHDDITLIAVLCTSHEKAVEEGVFEGAQEFA